MFLFHSGLQLVKNSGSIKSFEKNLSHNFRVWLVACRLICAALSRPPCGSAAGYVARTRTGGGASPVTSGLWTFAFASGLAPERDTTLRADLDAQWQGSQRHSLPVL